MKNLNINLFPYNHISLIKSHSLVLILCIVFDDIFFISYDFNSIYFQLGENLIHFTPPAVAN